MRRGAIIVCGGRSQRMGQDKASLPFGKTNLLAWMVAKFQAEPSLEQVVVAAAAGQLLPTLPDGVAVIRDRRPAAGPLEAVASGLLAFDGSVDAVATVGCDMPWVSRPVIDRLFGLLGDDEGVVVSDQGRRHPLLAVYRPRLVKLADAMLDEGVRRLGSLVDRGNCRLLDAEALRDIDPQLRCLYAMNDMEAYRCACAEITRIESNSDGAASAT
ncbi:MAG: molybdenum cofactor guanylyltransferase [Planctomycetales bacterium]|nr:molybdenum cofactor guanylyltransferase [Planctomycetales bacterium]